MSGDPDLGGDMRCVVPLFYDVQRRQIKVWAMLGWTTQPMRVAFASPPAVEILEGDDADITFTHRNARLATPVMVELYVSSLLDRAKFRALWDGCPTKADVVAALAPATPG